MGAWRKRGGLEVLGRKLVEGMRQRGIAQEYATAVYQQILGFGEYGFPESHSASFALLVYVSCWLKRYHPAAFTAALLNSQPMGFYAPAQLVADARRHGVPVRGVDVTASGWDCTLEKSGSDPDCSWGRDGPVKKSESGSDPDFSAPPERWGTQGPVLRLGLRMVAGFTEGGAQRLVEARSDRPFASVADLARRAKLDKRDLEALADAGALAALTGHRHAAVWDVAGVERLPALIEDSTFDEPSPDLPAPTEGEDITADYRRLGLTLGRHPLALLRERLAARRLVTAADLREMPHGRLARTAGIVIGRQRPDTASGVVFVTLEDETGTTNVIVWRDLGDRQRRELLGARLMAVYGRLERQGEVVHLIAGRLVDLTPMLGQLATRSRDFH
jgi:error-prone DNA polymerase